MNLRELYNLIEMIPAAGLEYITYRLVPPNELTKDERKLLTQWITKLSPGEFSDPVKKILLTLDYENIKWIQNPTEEECLKAVYANPNYIEYIEEPNENVQVAAIKNKLARPGAIFKLIKNPVQAVWVELVRERPSSILEMRNPNEGLQMAAIETKIDLILDNRINWAHSVRRYAFEQDPNYFPALVDPSEDDCWIGLRANSNFITLIKDPTPEMLAFSIIVA